MLAIISEIYDCAVHPENWPAALEKIAAHIGGNGITLWSHRATPDSFGLWVPCRIAPNTLEEYIQHYHQKDIWCKYALQHGMDASGKIMTGSTLVPRDEFFASEFYKDFLVRCDHVDILFAIIHANQDVESAIPAVHLSIYRGKADPLFDESDAAKLRVLMPHLQQATALNFKLAGQERLLEIAQSTVDLLSPALFFADKQGQIVYTNHAADKLLSCNDGIVLKERRLQAANSADTRGLHDLLGDEKPAQGETGGMLRIARPSGKTTYLAIKANMPAESTGAPDARRPHQILLIHDPAEDKPLNLDALRKLYGLTVAEADIAEALVKVGTPKEIALDLGISEHTVRSHLKSMFSKTGTQRQAELVQLVLSMPVL